MAGRRGGAGHLLAHLGGDEFVVLAGPPAGERAVRRMTTDLPAALRDPFVIDEHRLRVAIGIGAVLCPVAGGEPVALPAEADRKLHEAESLHAGRRAAPARHPGAPPNAGAQTASSTAEAPMPPAAQMPSSAVCLPVRASSLAMVVTMRAPVAPNG